MKFLLAAIVLLVVGIITGFLAPSLAEVYTTPEAIQRRGLSAVRFSFAVKFVAAAIVAGVLAALIYVLANKRWPGVVLPMFIGLGVGLAALFSVAAVFVLPQIGQNVDLKAIAPRIIILNFLWGVCFGIVNPLIMRSPW